MSLEDDLKSETLNINSITRLCLEEAEKRLGYSLGRNFIHVFISGRKEYRGLNPSPDLKDRAACVEYNRLLNMYAAGKVMVWIADQEEQLAYQKQTHPDGYKA